MCDYSLMSIPNRLAREGEELLAHRFSTGAVGLASSADLQTKAAPPGLEPRTFWSVVKEAFTSSKAEPVPAVCIPPGARLLMQDIPERMQRELEIGPEEGVIFTQISASAYNYRDAVRFRNGREILLQALREGQRVRVLDLSLAEATVFFREEDVQFSRRRR